MGKGEVMRVTDVSQAREGTIEARCVNLPYEPYVDVAWETLQELHERSQDEVRSCFNMQHALNQ